MDGIFVTKTVSVKRFTFFNGGYIVKNVSVKLYNFFNGGIIVDQERVCETIQFLQWRVFWWPRTCLSNSSVSSVEGVFVIKNVSVKLFSFIYGGSIGDQERVSQTLQLPQWRVYWWSRTCLSNSSAPSMESVLVIKNVSVKLFSFFNGGCIGDQERVCKTLQFLQWSVYRWSRTCLSKSSASLMDGIFVIKNVSVKLFSFINGGCIGDTRTCLSNSSAPSMESVLVIKNVSVKLFSFFNGGCIGDQERVCKTLQFLQWSVYRWSRTCLSKSSASLMDGIFVIKNVSLKFFSSLNGECIGDQERVCRPLQFLQWSVYRWSRTCLSKSSASLMDGIFVIKNVSVKLFSFINGGSIGDQERVSQTLQLPQWRVYWWSRTCL